MVGCARVSGLLWRRPTDILYELVVVVATTTTTTATIEQFGLTVEIVVAIWNVIYFLFVRFCRRRRRHYLLNSILFYLFYLVNVRRVHWLVRVSLCVWRKRTTMRWRVDIVVRLFRADRLGLVACVAWTFEPTFRRRIVVRHSPYDHHFYRVSADFILFYLEWDASHTTAVYVITKRATMRWRVDIVVRLFRADPFGLGLVCVTRTFEPTFQRIVVRFVIVVMWKLYFTSITSILPTWALYYSTIKLKLFF